MRRKDSSSSVTPSPKLATNSVEHAGDTVAVAFAAAAAAAAAAFADVTATAFSCAAVTCCVAAVN
ncbi:Uncharacterized protein BM_BM17595 [Brugia malayi]|uniref:Uncharacterized protein n=1 Tax=Brugia malayi TaxID=6279 RepID=A0A4E9FG31_BRUMA|nr:Uncharacterized protein BM_BM17595 [Brugia malayi]VIO95284.1 Uncharacterized protein BM_BM17595 [Brugia malayi]